MKMCQSLETLLYRGNDEDLKRIITRATGDLARKVFVNSENNRLLVLTFISLEIFFENEVNELRESIRNSVVFTEKFCALLKERDDLLAALNKLLNLDDHNLSNYQRLLRRTFIPLLQEKRVREKDQHIYNQTEELEKLLKVQQIIVELDNQSTEQDSLITINSNAEAQIKRSTFPKTPIIMVAVGGIFVFIYLASVVASGLTDAVYRHLTTVNRFEEANNTTLDNSTLSIIMNSNFTTPNATATTEPLPSSGTSTPVPDFLTIIETLSNKNHYGTSTEADTPPAPNRTSIPEKLKENTIFANKPSDIKGRTLEICDPNAVTTAIFHIDDHFDWYGIQVDCATRIHGLRIESYASIKNINEILNQTTNIHVLAINCDKIGIRNNPLLDNLQKVELKKLKSLEIVSQNGASDCSPVFSYLAGHVKYVKLKNLNISNVSITDENKPEIQRILSRMSASTPLKIFLNGVTMQTFLGIKTRSMTFHTFHFSVQNISSPSTTEFALPTFVNFLSKANYTQELSSNIPIPDEKMTKVFIDLMRLRLQSLAISVTVRKERKVFRFAFTKKLRWLEILELELLDWEPKNHINPYLLLTDFKLLPESLKEFRVVTNFNAKAQGAVDVHCRGYNKTSNANGGIGIMLDRCLDCYDEKGCISRRR